MKIVVWLFLGVTITKVFTNASYADSSLSSINSLIRINSKNEPVISNHVRFNTRGFTEAPAGTIGESHDWVNVGGLTANGSIENYRSHAISNGFDVAQTRYFYDDPSWIPHPVTFSGWIDGKILHLTQGTDMPPVGSVLNDSAGNILSGSTILRKIDTKPGDLATYMISKSQIVTSGQITAKNGAPASYNNFFVTISPNDVSHTWGSGVAEWNIVCRGGDVGFKRSRSDINIGPDGSGNYNPCGGLLLVPEASVFDDPLGGQGYNATYAYAIAPSASKNTVSHDHNKFYAGLLIEPDSIVGVTGRGIYETGDVSNTLKSYPYAPFDLDGAWLHGLVVAYSQLKNNDALTIASGQSIVNIVGSRRDKDRAPSQPTAIAKIVATGQEHAAGWTLSTAGNGSLLFDGHIYLKGAAPIIVYGFGSNATLMGNDMIGRISVGSDGAHAGAIKFAAAWSVPPVCTVQLENSSALVHAKPTQTGLTITGTMAAHSAITYTCFGIAP